MLQLANKKYDKVFKESIARLSLEEGRTLSIISKEYNIAKCTINGWIKASVKTVWSPKKKFHRVYTRKIKG